MSSIKHKHTRERVNTSLESTPAELPETINYPIFCLHYLSQEYCITKCDKDEKAGFSDAIRILAKQTWNEIITNRVLDYEKIKDKRDIRESIPSGLTEDLPIIGFRFDGRKRMVGCRKGYVFHIIWLDTKLKLYNHGR